jgi:hypothetical protein
MSNPGCTKDCHEEQCNQCISDEYEGDPSNGEPCFKKVGGKGVRFNLSSSSIDFTVVTPKFYNVEIRLFVDVLEGEVDVFVTKVKKHFHFDVDTFSQKSILWPKKVRRRSVGSKSEGSIQSFTYSDIPNLQTISMTPYGKASHFSKYERDMHVVSRVKRRAAIRIGYEDHDFSKEWFYVGISTVSRYGSSGARVLVYFDQDLASMQLLLFFLVITVVVLFTLTALIMLFKLKMQARRRAQQQAREIQLETMASRPYAPYELLIKRNLPLENLRRIPPKAASKTMMSMVMGRFQSSNNEDAGYCQVANTPVSPVTLQPTDNLHAAVLTAFIQLPENKVCMWNFALASGLATYTPQQLVDVRQNTGAQGRTVTTRVHDTTIM